VGAGRIGELLVGAYAGSLIRPQHAYPGTCKDHWLAFLWLAGISASGKKKAQLEGPLPTGPSPLSRGGGRPVASKAGGLWPSDGGIFEDRMRFEDWSRAYVSLSAGPRFSPPRCRVIFMVPLFGARLHGG